MSGDKLYAAQFTFCTFVRTQRTRHVRYEVEAVDPLTGIKDAARVRPTLNG